uniref:Kinetochore protein Nuf2 N-terminal domain-containing protein n=1 Tax=Salarias fasciatus TaxID=181472 RepID=A0A672ISS9_SALFA
TPTPKAETVQTLYMTVLRHLFRFKPECHSMVSTPPYSLIQTHFFWSHVSTCCDLVALTSPEKQRTLTILSAIMNFLHFRKQRMEMILEKQARLRADVERLQAHTRGIRDAERKIEITIPPEQQATLSELNTTTAHEHQEVLQKELKSLCVEEGQLKRALDMKLNIWRQQEVKERHVKEVLGYGQCTHIHQRREDMADKIQKISGQTQQLRAEIKSLRDVCGEETEKAQVPAIYNTLSAAMDKLHQRIEDHSTDLKLAVAKLSANI